jgi:hypothetical protein
MLKQSLLACVALVVAFSRYLLDKIDPKMQKVFRFIEIPCFVYLTYYGILLRRWFWGSKAALRTRLFSF